MQSRLLTQKEIAVQIGVSPRTIRSWTQNRILPVLKVGGVVRYDREKVRKALEAFEQRSQFSDAVWRHLGSLTSSR